MVEGQLLDKKSLKTISGKTADFDELAKDCVAFANAVGGSLYIGIEDDAEEPSASQRIPDELLGKLMKRIGELSVNVGISPIKKVANNGGEYIELKIFRSAASIASTTSGKYYIRIDDQSKPLYPDELIRLIADKTAYNWETRVTQNIPWKSVDNKKLYQFILELKQSDRVSSFVKDKTESEILEYYNFVDANGILTNLGVLWIGKREQRARLLYAPVVQYIKYDEDGRKIRKIPWDDFSLNPKELIETIWNEIPEWRESYEVADGLFRKNIPAYDEIVVRELIANALVHRPYTTRGDIFINLYPDKLEVINPGVFPLGVNSQNILHKTVKRNEHLAKVFYDLHLMEREGSGYDMMYETLLTTGRSVPDAYEGDDFIRVTINRKVVSVEAAKLMNEATNRFGLSRKEAICLGLIAQRECVSSFQLTKLLELNEKDALRAWIGRLIDKKIVIPKGKTKGTMYCVNNKVLQDTNFKGKTSLIQIEPYRIRQLIIEDLKKYNKASLSEINERIGKEIPRKEVIKQAKYLIEQEKIDSEGSTRWTRYFIKK
jgi:ATP-dependent DNA helicase RecG